MAKSGDAKSGVRTPKKGAGLWRWARRIALVLAVCVLVLVCAVLWLTQTGSGRQFLIDRVASVLSAQVFEGTFTADRIEGPVFGHLTLYDGALTDDHGKTAATIDRVRVQYRLGELLHKHLMIDALDIHGLHLNGRIREDGSLNLAHLLQPSDKEPPPKSDTPGLAITISRLSLDGSDVRIVDGRTDELVVDFADPRIVGDFDMDGRGSLHAGISELGGTLSFGLAPGKTFPARIDDLSVDMKPETIDFAAGRVTVGETGLFGFEGSVQRKDAGDKGLFKYFKASIPQLVFSPEEVRAFFPGIPLATTLRIDASVEGPPDAVTLNAALRGAGQGATAEATVDLTEGVDAELHGSLQVEHFQPQLWLAMQGLKGDLNAEVRFWVRGLTPQRLKAGLEVDIRPSTLLGYKLDSGTLGLGYTQETVTLRTLDFRAGRASLAGDGTASLDGKLDLNVHLDVPDLADLAVRAPGNNIMRGQIKADVQAKGQVPIDAIQGDALSDLQGIADHVVRHLDLKGELRANGVRTPGVSVRDARVDLTNVRGDAVDFDLRGALTGVHAGGLDIDTSHLSARIEGQHVHVDGEVKAMDASARIVADGTWAAHRISLTVSTLALRKDDVDGALRRPARVDVRLLDGGGLASVTVDDLDLRGSGISARVDHLRYDKTGRVRGTFKAHIRDLRALFELRALASFRSLGLAGGVAVNGSVSGSPRRLRYDVTVRARALHAMGLGPVTGTLRAHQQRDRLTADGLLCLDGVPQANPHNSAYCGTGTVLFLAKDLVLPFLPGFGRLGPRFNPRGMLGGYAEMGPVKLSRFANAVEPIAQYGVRGRLHVRAYLAGTFDKANIAAFVDLGDGWVNLPASSGKEDTVAFGPIAAHLNIKLANTQQGRSALHWALSGDGLRVGTKTWAHANGDVQTPIRRFLLGEIDASALVSQTVGTIVSLEVPTRRFSDLPEGLLPEALDRRGAVNLDVDVTRQQGFSSAKMLFHGQHLKWDDTGPAEVFATLVSSDDTALHIDAESEDTSARATIDASLAASLETLATRGIRPDDKLKARVDIPDMPLSSIPIAAVRDKIDTLTGARPGARTPILGGYLDVFHTLGDLRASGRFRVRNIGTANGDVTEMGLELLFGPDNVLGFGTDDARRVQALATICGPGDQCAMRLYAAIHPGVSSGDFLFGTDDVRAQALEHLQHSAYAAHLFADDAPLGALAPIWLFADIANHVDGAIDADLAVRGALGSFPQIRGTLDVKHAKADILPLARTIQDFDLKVRAKPAEIDIERLHLDDGVGTADGHGTMRYVRGSGPHAELELSFDRFLLADASGVGAYLTSTIPIEASMGDGALNVDVALHNATVYVPDSAISGASGGPSSVPDNVIFLDKGEDLTSYVLAKERQALVEKARAPRLEKVSLPINVHVHSREDVQIQQRFADLSAAVDMTLQLKGGELGTSGGVTVKDGYAQAFGKRFNIENGQVLFDDGGDGPFDPRIRVSASHRLSRKTEALLEDSPSGQYASVSVVIDSHLSDLDVTLRSDPQMSESNILNVLLTGKPLDTDSDERPDALATAGTLLAGFLTDQMGTNPVLDTLTLDLNDTGGTIDPRLEGGRYFGKKKRIYASVAYIPGADANQNSVEVSWQFILAQLRRSSLRLELRWGDRRTGAAEFLYNLRVNKGWSWVR